MAKHIVLVDTYVKVNKLYPSTSHRTPEWFAAHPEYDVMHRKLVESIKRDGLNDPLLVHNEQDNGFYRVDVGNQRLRAIKEIGAKSVRCVVHCTSDQFKIPDGEVLSINKVLARHYTDKKIIKVENDFTHLLILTEHNFDPDKPC
jgi:hypothetical protein